jgi:hypothetical protein
MCHWWIYGLFMKLDGLDVLKRYTPGANFCTEYLPFGLCCYATARQVKRNKKWWTCFPTSTTTTTSIQRYQQAANESRNRIKFLVQHGCVNHLHVLHMLDAEFYALFYNRQNNSKHTTRTTTTTNSTTKSKGHTSWVL